MLGRSESSKPADASDQGYGSQSALSHAPDDQGYQQDMSSPLAHSMGRHPSHQGDFNNLFGEFDQSRMDTLAGVGAVADQFSGRRESNSRFHGTRASVEDANAMAMLYDAASQQLIPPVDSMLHSPMGTRHSMPEIHVTGYDSYGYQQQRVNPMPQEDRSSKRQKVSGSTDSQQGPMAGNPDGEHICKECNKTKKRECDLR